MDLTALTWQASVVLIYVSFNREAGVANATLASFLCPRPSLASRQLGSPSLAAFSRIRYRVCALAASVLSLRTCQERTAIFIGRRQHRTALHPGPAEHPPYPRSNQCLALAPRATASIRTDVDAEDTSRAAKLLLCKAKGES